MAEETTEQVAEVTQETVKEVNAFVQYFQDSVPALVAFGVKVLIALVVFFVGRCIIKWIRKIVRKSLERSSIDKGAEQFIDSLLKFGLYLFLIFSIAVNLGVDTASVAALLASAGVAVGLAVQGSLSNLAGGVFILLLKPFMVGDYIFESATNYEGTVKEIRIFHTKLTTIDNKEIVIPNGNLASCTIVNANKQEERKLDLRVTISYDADIKEAKKVLRKVLTDDPDVKKDHEILVFVNDLKDSAVEIGLRADVRTEAYWETRWRVLENAKLTLDEHQIEIPYPQMTIHYPKHLDNSK